MLDTYIFHFMLGNWDLRIWWHFKVYIILSKYKVWHLCSKMLEEKLNQFCWPDMDCTYWQHCTCLPYICDNIKNISDIKLMLNMVCAFSLSLPPSLSLHIYIYIYIYIWIQTQIHIIYIYTYIDFMYNLIYIGACMYVCMYVCMHSKINQGKENLITWSMHS